MAEVVVGAPNADAVVDDASHVVERYERAGFALAGYAWTTHAAAGPSSLTLSFDAARPDAVAPPPWVPNRPQRERPSLAPIVFNAVVIAIFVVLIVFLIWSRAQA